MGRTGISVHMTDEEARLVSIQFKIIENYLKRIIEKYVPASTRQPAECMDYKTLKHHGYVIKGVADAKVKELEARLEAEKTQLSLF